MKNQDNYPSSDPVPDELRELDQSMVRHMRYHVALPDALRRGSGMLLNGLSFVGEAMSPMSVVRVPHAVSNSQDYCRATNVSTPRP